MGKEGGGVSRGRRRRWSVSVGCGLTLLNVAFSSGRVVAPYWSGGDGAGQFRVTVARAVPSHALYIMRWD